ncbi:phosphoribosylanthranilate isomerase [Rhizosaccharibacter radicis]|uniref:N-(5'-phosphoribosyl)anthranilate isomerase n=1 Tax=Rhizosaccharibacter radicis TaxID=2782605 RepID=A0ABT1W0K0_9PROT|nr:phosphoribosylanthranilate isomerase [Acetobacteraceae bacterium KSS12]
MIRVKICGINDEPGLDAALDGGADWVGLVFFRRSPRFLEPARAALLARRAAGRAAVVGLMVSPADQEIRDLVEACPLDAIQLYGRDDLPSGAIGEGRPVWHAVPVAAPEDLPESTPADTLVVEPRPARTATRPGGNGTPMDWSLLRHWKAPVPWLLAGGLTAENVAGAIRLSGATAVDVSSGVESAPGMKDPERIHAFIRAARAAVPGS